MLVLRLPSLVSPALVVWVVGVFRIVVTVWILYDNPYLESAPLDRTISVDEEERAYKAVPVDMIGTG